jgi:hypothetical protein
MSLFGNIKNLIGINKQENFDAETTDQISILKDENRVLKDKVNLMLKENELLQQSVFNDEIASKTQFGKIFSGLKTAFFSNESLTGVNQSVVDFKTFLFENLLYHSENIEEDDIEYLNNITISEEDWSKNRELYIFKQKLLSRNYQELIKNMLISNELNEFYKAKTDVSKVEKVSVGTVKQEVKNKYEDLLFDSFKDRKEEKVSNIYVKTEKIPISKDERQNIPIDIRQSDKKVPEVKQFIAEVNTIKPNIRNEKISTISMEEYEDFDLSKIATKKIIPTTTNKQASSNELIKENSSNSLRKVDKVNKKDQDNNNDFFSSKSH